jgi:haloalkane dehalogenase
VERRELLRLSVGALLTSALGTAVSPVLARNTAGAEDVVASERYNKERRFLATPYARIAYIDRGRGNAVLFLHGFPLSSFQWRGAIDRLSSERRCIAPDLMGLGYTEVAENRSVAPAAQVDMITALLDGLSIPKVDLIANDSGGAIAQLFMTKHRERVRTALLTNCDVEINSPPAALLPVILPQMMGITRLRTAKLFFPEERPDIIAREARNLWELASVRFFNNA